MRKNQDKRQQAIDAYQKAIALKYEGVGAPLVTASGEGIVAIHLA